MSVDDLPELDDLDAATAAPETERVDVDALIREAGATLALNGFDPIAAGRALGMDDRAIKFAVGLLQGRSATDALRSTGRAYPSDEKGQATFRSAASKLANTRRMKKFMERAREHRAGVTDAPLDDATKLAILAKIARSNNPTLQVRAVQAHQQLQNDLVGRARDAEVNRDPVETLKAIARISPLCAVVANELARVHGIDFRSADAPALPAGASHQQAAVAGLGGNGAHVPASGADARE